MIHSLSKSIAVFLFDDNDKYPIDIYIYGIELIISSILGKLAVFLAGIVIGYIFETIVFMFVLSLIRHFSGGYHADTYLKCGLMYFISFALVMLTYMLISNKNNLFYIILFVVVFIITTFIFIKFAPVKSKNKELDFRDSIRYKWLSVLTFVAVFAFTTILFICGLVQVLIAIPTLLVVDISMLVVVILTKRRSGNENL